MIAVLLIALQIAAAPGASITVRAERSEAVVPLVQTGAGPAISLDRLAPVMPIAWRMAPDGRYIVAFAGVEMELTEGVPFARLQDGIVPLVGAPFLREGRLFVPLQVVADLVPARAKSRLRYTASTGELRVLGSTEPARVATAPVATTTLPTISRNAAAERAVGTRPTRPQPSGKLRHGKRWIVIVDAGHGGPDNGMTGPIGSSWKMYEKNVTLAVAKRLRAALVSRGVDVVMTRSTDTLIALHDRGRIANDSHGDLFLSVHVNAANMGWKKPGEARGFETYFLAEARTEDDRRVERMENASVAFETDASVQSGDPLNFIKNDMAQNEHLRESSELADLIQRRLGQMHPGPDRGVKQAGFAVLVTAFMPSVLVEIGFGTNIAEARYLTDEAQQTAIADAIANAAMEYLGHYEQRLIPVPR